MRWTQLSRQSSRHSAPAPSVDPLGSRRIVVATTQGRAYYRFCSALRSMGLRFESVLPSRVPRRASAVLTTAAEAPRESPVPVILDDELGRHPTVLRGMLVRELGCGFGAPHLVMGVDPGKRPGLSVWYHGREIESSTQPSPGALVSHMIEIMSGLRASAKKVKIGDGDSSAARRIAAQLRLTYCSDFDLQVVDERGTSPRVKNCNRRGARDMVSARFIAGRSAPAVHLLPPSLTG